MKLPIYLDNHSTTQVDPRVVDAMLPCFGELYGNAASKQHEYGWRAEAAVEKARGEIARLIECDAKEIVFTSGATESINLAIKGVAEAYASKGRHIITVATEHKAVLDTCKRLEKYGFSITYLPVDTNGLVSVDLIRSSIAPSTILVTVMIANNEIGTIAPIEEIGNVCRERGVLFHTDATQAVGKIPVGVERMKIDLMSFSAHKMYGPKGVGALYVRQKVKVAPQLDGGGHEHGYRSGTLNVPAIVGFGKAAEIAAREMKGDADRLARLRDTFVEALKRELDEIQINGHPTERLPQNANITFVGTKADRLMMDMKDIAVSSGSACSSASPEPSHVLRALGLSDDEVLASIRFGLGRFTTEEEIGYTIGRVVEVVKRARERSYSLTHS
ncbi:MAG: IscS subfamily cysteine desulfurase [Ignavibacteriae bacterium]|nr:IscS subfamily cysteine desulfurase [Ignavibacteriota bacterium]